MKRPRGTGSIFQLKESRNWYLKYHRNGVPIRESSGTDNKRKAEKLLQQRIGEVATDTFIEPKNRKVTVDELYRALLDDYRNNGLASLEGAQQRWEWTPKGADKPEDGRLKQRFGGLRALAVSTESLNRYVAWCREQGLSNATINRDLSALRRAFTLAHRAGKIHKVPNFPHLKESAPRDGFIEQIDYTKLAQHATELWLRAFLCAAYLGMRKGELVGDPRKQYQDALRVRHVDLASRTIRLKETKNGDDRVVPMTQELYTLMAACISGKEQDDFVFTRKNGKQVKDFRGRWEALLNEAGVSKKRVHDCRRSAVRNMERAVVPRSVAMKISGHRTESVYRRYAIVSESDLLEAAKRIEASSKVWAEFGQSQHDNSEAQGASVNASRLN